MAKEKDEWVPCDVYFAQQGVPRINGAGVVALSAERDHSMWCPATGDVHFDRGGQPYLFSMRAIACIVSPRPDAGKPGA